MKKHTTAYMNILLAVTTIFSFVLYFFAIGIALPTDYEDSYKKKLLRWLILGCTFYLTTKTMFSNFKNRIISKSTIDNS